MTHISDRITEYHAWLSMTQYRRFRQVSHMSLSKRVQDGSGYTITPVTFWTQKVDLWPRFAAYRHFGCCSGCTLRNWWRTDVEISHKDHEFAAMRPNKPKDW